MPSNADSVAASSLHFASIAAQPPSSTRAPSTRPSSTRAPSPRADMLTRRRLEKTISSTRTAESRDTLLHVDGSGTRVIDDLLRGMSGSATEHESFTKGTKRPREAMTEEIEKMHAEGRSARKKRKTKQSDSPSTKSTVGGRPKTRQELQHRHRESGASGPSHMNGSQHHESGDEANGQALAEIPVQRSTSSRGGRQ